MAEMVNQSELATLLGVSVPTVATLRADGMPVISEGRNGVGYEFDPGKQITLEYRYFNGPEIDEFNVHGDDRIEDQPADYDYSSHNVMIGMKFGL